MLLTLIDCICAYVPYYVVLTNCDFVLFQLFIYLQKKIVVCACPFFPSMNKMINLFFTL